MDHLFDDISRLGEATIMEKREKLSIIIFSAFTLGAGFIGKAVDTVLTDQPEGQSLGMLIWLVLPLVVSIIIRLANKGHYEPVGFRPNFGSNRAISNQVIYAIAVLIFPLITAISIAVAYLFGTITFNGYDKTLIGAVIAGAVLKNLIEEITWRGNMVPFFEKTGLNDFLFYLVTGLIWGCWHIPYYLFFLGAPDSQKTKLIVAGIIYMLLWTPLFTEVRRITKSFWPAYLLHLTEECVPMLLLVTVGVFTLEGTYDIFMNPINGIIPAVIILATGLLLRKHRISKVGARPITGSEHE